MHKSPTRISKNNTERYITKMGCEVGRWMELPQNHASTVTRVSELEAITLISRNN
jgi:hypothetical protein